MTTYHMALLLLVAICVALLIILDDMGRKIRDHFKVSLPDDGTVSKASDSVCSEDCRCKKNSSTSVVEG